ncbi:PD-(D/E)XK nuclease-like domain-containing protein [Geminicoccus flavidas]|uniref:PD-(D/E)XK nuclease-like domain-containing protein n=1 Tax=Geminicoccus flavidas TaxID=2506407 RepID=UPI00135C95F4|nr:PD-(D/E)XK nuclease-like domain-containing protein [Geminicoccus flavidas]
MEIEPHGLVECTNEEYHSGPGISKSHLDWIAPELDRTPRHYWHQYLNPEREPEENTPALIFGDAVHTAILEPDRFHEHVIKGLDHDRRSTANKFAWAQFEEEHAGKIILKVDDYAKVLRIRDVVHAHPVVGPMLRNGKAEQSFYTVDKETGLLIKCRTDFLSDGGEYILDVKTAESASPRKFAKSVAEHRYDVQVGHYEPIFEDLYGERPKHWFFLAIEKDEPFAMGLHLFRDIDRAPGRARARRDLLLIAQCRNEGHWPDHAFDATPLDLPYWYNRNDGY